MDPLMKLEMALKGMARDGIDSTARAAAPRVKVAIDQRFASGMAPVRSGDLRGSVRATPLGAKVEISSPLPYAQFHESEIVPPPAEMEAIMDKATEQALNAKLRGVG